jgi:5-methylcytosine-specific restriction endonuclease McrA
MVQCKRPAAKAIKAASRIVQRLADIYPNQIVIHEHFVYDGNRVAALFKCLRCESPFYQSPGSLLNARCGCPFCDQKRPRLKCPTKLDLPRSRKSPDITRRRQQKAAYQAKRRATPQGVAERDTENGRQRLRRTNTPEYIFLDSEWHEVDRKETWRIFGHYLLPPDERKAIQELYLEAQYRTETTGVEHHVDHIQPLSKGGEHLMYNLQILTAEENLSKHNTFRLEDQIELARRLFG